MPRTHVVPRLAVYVSFALLLIAASQAARAQSPGSQDPVASLKQSFASPPDDCRIMVRWWWFGPSVAKDELARELRAMKAGGIGGVEVQTTYPLALDDPGNGFHNFPFLSDEHIDDLRFASEEARELGLRFDLTLASGWPYGGPHIPVTQAAGMLRVVATPVPDGTTSVAVPDVGLGEKFLAAFLVSAPQGKIAVEGAQQISDIRDGRIHVPHADGPHDVLFFIASRTGQQVKRPALGAEGFVLDHYDRAAIENHLHAVGDRFMQAFGSNPPYAIFSDSLEVYESNWTGDFLEQFQKRRGYDLTPYLPALVGNIGSATGAVRHDWGRTLTELADENYLTPLEEWAKAHGTRFRSQNYGTPPTTLSSNALVDLPEGEGWLWKGFSAVRWASSANHLYGRTVTSSETWTWLHSPAFRATPLDMKVAADAYFLDGSNQLIGHGWPYSPPSAGEPGWRFYAAAVFDDHNPWWLVMPDVTRYLQRVSFMLRQGTPANDVALLLPTDDAWAQFTAVVASSAPRAGFGAPPGANRPAAPTGAAALPPGVIVPPTPGASISVNQVIAPMLGNVVIPQILDAGFNFDFIDADAIDKVGIPYRVLIVPGIDRIPLATYRKIEAFAKNGGIVIATKRLPSLAPGMKEDAADTPQIQALSQSLFQAAGAPGHFLQDETQLGAALAQWTKPDVVLLPPAPNIGFVHRKLPFADIYFIANTSNQIVRTKAAFRVSSQQAESWDPVSGESESLGTTSSVDLELQPYQSRFLIFSAQKPAPAKPPKQPVPKPKTLPVPIDLEANWNVKFGDAGETVAMDKLRSWTDTDGTKYFSGEATYEKTIDVPEKMTKSGFRLVLDFGEGIPTEIPAVRPGFGSDGTGSSSPRTQAWLDSPVREAAVVYINGERAGSVWLPPYEVDVTKFLHTGENQLKLVVGNLAINEMAGRALPDYRLLNDRFGERFQPQDLNNLQPLPSGILGGLRLVARP
ncbi:MAG: glycosyl hydrolase [Candidatus Acidiferrales bacterium]